MVVLGSHYDMVVFGSHHDIVVTGAWFAPASHTLMLCWLLGCVWDLWLWDGRHEPVPLLHAASAVGVACPTMHVAPMRTGEVVVVDRVPRGC